jgi:hypothetical protein
VSGDGDHLQPHRAGADHGHPVAGADLALIVDGVQAVGQRLHEHRALDGHVPDREGAV